jgi:hypothetical protein
MRPERILLSAILLPAVALAQLGADRSSSVAYNSNVITNRAWRRDVVMRHEPSGEIFNDRGMVGSAAEVAAANVVADGAAEVAEGANAAMTNELRRLDEAAAGAATNALALALVVRPETSRTNLTFFVVKTETDGYTDTQFVWCNWDLALAPNRFVVYQTFGRCSTNKFNWTDWTVKTNVTVNGRTWTGCRKGTVTRPDWARNGSCLDVRNDRLGGPSGFDFGDLTLTVGGRTPFTGFVTNSVTGEVLYFDQGFHKGNPEAE